MTAHQNLEDPTNRIVSVFDRPEHAEAARTALVESGIVPTQIRVLSGERAGDNVDTSPKWFADTDEEIERYQRELRAGNTVVSVPVQGQDDRESIHAILKSHDARLITHFGQWVTEMMR
jgi:hypothetical protein